MGTRVQSKPQFPGYHSGSDQNKKMCTTSRDPFRESMISENSEYHNSCLRRAAIDGHAGNAKEYVKQTLLKQESIFRDQLHELHRLYHKQKELMRDQSRRMDESTNTNSGFWVSPQFTRSFLAEREGADFVDLKSSNDVNQPTVFQNGVPPQQWKHKIPTSGLLWNTEKMQSSVGQKGKEIPYMMNLDSLKNHSQQFFKKESTNFASNVVAKVSYKTDSNTPMKIFGIPITNVHAIKDQVLSSLPLKASDSIREAENHDASLVIDQKEGGFGMQSGQNSCSSCFRPNLDLNLSPSEEEPLSNACTPQVPGELDKFAAETLLAISSSPSSVLQWFAEVVTSNDINSISNAWAEESIPEGMDEFEYLTLNLKEMTEDEYMCKTVILEAEKDENVPPKRARKGQGRKGRKRKDFQKDLLPSIASLARRDISDDMHTFEESLAATGVSWQSSMSKKAATRGSKAKKRVADPLPVAVEAGPADVKQPETTTLSGWGKGKRTRRLPRQSGDGNGNKSLSIRG